VQLANRINRVFQQAGPTAPQSVTAIDATLVLLGAPDPLGTATPQDAAAYSTGGKSLTPSQVAAYWAASLQDYLAVFAYNQRPTQLIQFTPQAKALIDLQAAAARRVGADGGIPAAMAYPTPPELARVIRDLALGPTGASSKQATTQAAVVLVGVWEGQASDPGGVQTVRVEFELDGTRLKGHMETVAGSASMGRPLEKVSFEKGVVRFTIESGAGPYQFQGTLDGRTLKGTIQGSRGAGTFTLQFVG
jgi:hypothetical protein